MTATEIERPQAKQGIESEKSRSHAEVELTKDSLIVHMRPLDKAFSLHGDLTIPLGHITGAYADPTGAKDLGIKLGGAQIPGTDISVGRFSKKDKDTKKREMTFRDVHHAENVIVIESKDERYKQIIIDVENPEATINQIRAAIAKKE